MKSIEALFSYVSGKILEKRHSEVNGELEVCYQYGRTVLHSKNANYSYDTLHKLFQRAFKYFDIRNRKIKKVLILGFGGGSVASILLYEFKLEVEITGIELDPIVLELGQKYFATDRMPDVEIVQDHVKNFVLKGGTQYDLIVHDVFVDKDVPPELINDEYVENLIERTSNGGMGLFNFIVENKIQDEQWKKLYYFFANKGLHLVTKSFSTINRMLIWERNLK